MLKESIHLEKTTPIQLKFYFKYYLLDMEEAFRLDISNVFIIHVIIQKGHHRSPNFYNYSYFTKQHQLLHPLKYIPLPPIFFEKLLR